MTSAMTPGMMSEIMATTHVIAWTACPAPATVAIPFTIAMPTMVAKVPATSEVTRHASARATVASVPAEYPNARRTHVEHDRVHEGDACPLCSHGTLFELREPERIVRITGQAPLAAHIWECDRLRCSGCGGVFTAQAPIEAQGPKYDDQAVAMMALLRYGTGMPLNRLDRLQRNLQTPVPASTQWEVARDHVEAVAPVYDELCRRAASGTVMHNDDTSVRILDLMGKRRAELLENGELPDPDRNGLFTTGVVSITDAGPIALFFSGRKHAPGENFTTLLDAREPGLPPPHSHVRRSRSQPSQGSRRD